jgi:parvulin-like peptidyl-prolyl isomerase
VTTTFRLLAVAVCATVLAACTGSSSSGDVAATVNGTDIPRPVVTDAVEELHGVSELSAEERQELASRIEVQERETLRLYIVNGILDGILEDRGIEVDDARVQELREDAIETAGSEDALRESVAEVQLSLEMFNDVYLPQQAMIAAIRDDLAEGSDVEMRTARHILVDDEQTAQDAVDRIEEGEDFGAVAAELSTDQGTAASGGELPPAQRGQYVPEFDEATWEAELGELVGPIETDFGYHLIMVEERSDAETVPLEEVSENIKNHLIQNERQQSAETYISSLREDADIEVLVDVSKIRMSQPAQNPAE